MASFSLSRPQSPTDYHGSDSSIDSGIRSNINDINENCGNKDRALVVVVDYCEAMDVFQCCQVLREFGMKVVLVGLQTDRPIVLRNGAIRSKVARSQPAKIEILPVAAR